MQAKISAGQLAREIGESQAFAIESRFGTLDTNFYVFRVNYAELKALLSTTQTAELMFKYEETNRILQELTRLLHNFLASARSLVDHTRAVMKEWYGGTELHYEYTQEIQKRIISKELPGFIEELRNYALHYRLPVTTATVKVWYDPATSQQRENASLILEKPILLQWSGWTAKGKRFLLNADKEIRIETLVDQYFQDIQNLHQWISASLQNEHKELLKWLEEKRVQLEKALDLNKSV